VSKINDGGPAFPQPDLSGYGMGPMEGPDGSYLVSGMSIRDYIAIKIAAAAMVSATGLGESTPGERASAFAAVAGISYEFADAMLAAREAKP